MSLHSSIGEAIEVENSIVEVPLSAVRRRGRRSSFSAVSRHKSSYEKLLVRRGSRKVSNLRHLTDAPPSVNLLEKPKKCG